MKIELDIRKSVDENATTYFEKAKKSKKKIDGVLKAIKIYEDKLEKQKVEHEKKQESVVVKKARKSEWFEKFRWFISSDELLVIGGKDATTNEIIIKKYADKDDIVFHTDMAGSPFVVVKNDKHQKIPKTTLSETASFTAIFSRGWKQGLSSIDVFYVKPDQVTKKAKAGESLAKGAFMIYGETKYLPPIMSYAVGVKDGKIMGGPLSAVKKHCKEYVEIIQGNDKISDVAKKIKRILGGNLDEVIRALPVGCKIKKKL